MTVRLCVPPIDNSCPIDEHRHGLYGTVCLCVFVILYANQPRRSYKMRSPSNTNGFIVYLTHISMFSFSILCMCLCTSVTEYLRVWMTWYSMHYPLLNSDPGSQLFTSIFHDPRWRECTYLLQPYIVLSCSHLPTVPPSEEERKIKER